MTFKRLVSSLLFGALACVALSLPASAETKQIVAFGDSLMAGYQLAPGDSFPEKLEKVLKDEGHDVVIVGAGVSGDTTSDGLARLDWSVDDDADLVILELGANDMLRGIAPKITQANLDQMISRLKDRGIPVLLAGMVAAPNLGPDYANEFNPIYPDLAKQYDLRLYPFFLNGVAAQPGLQLSDGMHPNAAGVDKIVAGILPMVVEELAAASAED